MVWEGKAVFSAVRHFSHWSFTPSRWLPAGLEASKSSDRIFKRTACTSLIPNKSIPGQTKRGPYQLTRSIEFVGKSFLAYLTPNEPLIIKKVPPIIQIARKKNCKKITELFHKRGFHVTRQAFLRFNNDLAKNCKKSKKISK